VSNVYPVIPGVSAGGHVTRGGAWHSGSGYGCQKCEAAKPAAPRLTERQREEAHRRLLRKPKVQQLRSVVEMMPEDVATRFLSIYGRGGIAIGTAFFRALPLYEQTVLERSVVNPVGVDHVVAVVNALELLTSPR
jgi:hypothetical protein